MEIKDEGPIHEFFEQMVHLLQCETFQTSLNRHIEKKGTTYKALLSYRERKKCDEIYFNQDHWREIC